MTLPGDYWLRRLSRVITRRRAGLALEVLVNLVLPWVFWHLARPRFGEVHAIMASAVPPVLWSLGEFAHRRRIDSLSVLVLSGIALSLAGFALGGSPRLLLVRESLVTGLIGLAFIASAVLGKPLVYILARAGLSRRSEAERAAFESEQENPSFRRLLTVITVVWGIGLVAETLLRVTLAFTLPVGRYLIVGPIVGYATIGLLVLWAFLYARSTASDP